MQAIAVTLVFFGATAGVWFGLVEDMKFAFILGVVGWAVSTIAVFNGGFSRTWIGINVSNATMPSAPAREQGMAPGTMATYVAIVAIVGATFAGTAGVWFALVDDIKYLFPLGLAAWAAAFILAFRGSAAR